MLQWNKVFKKEGKFFTKIQEDIPKVMRLFRKHHIKKILDLGCGSGRHTVYFAKRGFDVYGFDVAKEGLKVTRTWLKKEKLKAKLKRGSIYKKLPYPANSFDAVICVQVIHHARIKEIRKAIKEIERILRPNGLIFITVRKRVAKKYRLQFKVIASRTYIPIEGRERGLIHYLYNKELLKKDFKIFKIYDIWTDATRHYCLLGELKK